MIDTTTIAAVLLSVLTGACASDARGPAAPSAAAPSEGRAAPMAGDLPSMTQAALADAAQRTRLDASALKVLSAEKVTWSDGALGCPAPGVMYTMALVPGYRIRIQAGSEVLDYHAGSRGKPVLCPPGRAKDPVAEGGRI